MAGGLAGKMSRKRCGKRILRLGRPEGLGGGDGDLGGSIFGGKISYRLNSSIKIVFQRI
jgi:hypothetical protein